MIALVKLDAVRNCLHRMKAGGGVYICRGAAGHLGQHDYLPADMVIVARPRAVAPLAERQLVGSIPRH
ncbi:MAG: hypothetical protein ACTHMG_06620 [Sphingomonas sp.]